MLIPPKYTLTPQISELLQSIEASRQVIDSIQIAPEIENNIRRQSTLRTSLYSARIEGNSLTMDTLTQPSKTQQKAEVFNILKAMNFINQKKNKDITIAHILEIHRLAAEGLTDEASLGRFRSEQNAIFNSAGIAIYMPPPPRYIEGFLEKIIRYIYSPKERFVPIKAVLAHYSFEKLHPFLDGNGRVGRLLLQKILSQNGYGMKGILGIEEYLDNHRAEYYRALEEPEKDVTDYIEFMLTSIAEEAKEAKELVMQKQIAEIEDYLLPRRAEILRIIKDQKLVNFDQLRRRFANVNERTLRYDLKRLQDGELIRKRGTTKGVYYEAV
jgi:Fic family protein